MKARRMAQIETVRSSFSFFFRSSRCQCLLKHRRMRTEKLPPANASERMRYMRHDDLKQKLNGQHPSIPFLELRTMTDAESILSSQRIRPILFHPLPLTLSQSLIGSSILLTYFFSQCGSAAVPNFTTRSTYYFCT